MATTEPTIDNATITNLTTDQDFSNILSICLGAHIVYMVISTYILLCLVVYGVKARRWNWKTDSGKLHIACVVTVAVTMPRSFGILFLYLAPIISALDHCELIIDFSHGSGTFALMFIYIFLWMRQRTIYTNSYMKALTPKWLNYFSIGVLGYVIIFFTSAIFGFTIPPSYTSTQTSCVVDITKMDYWGLIRGLVLGYAVTIGQAVMFLLFAYPMIRVKLAQQGNNRQSGNDPIIDTIKRSTIGAAVVVTFSIASVNIAMNYLGHYPVAVAEPLYDLNYAMSYLSLVATFENYPEILTSFCRKIEPVGFGSQRRSLRNTFNATVSGGHLDSQRTKSKQFSNRAGPTSA